MAASRIGKIVGFVAKLLEIVWTCCILQMLLGVACHQNDGFEGFLLCRKCGYEVAKAHDLFSMPSSSAHRQRNDTIVHSNRVLIQLFKNPQGMYFEVITCTDAEVERSSERFATDSWFPGYTWSVASCPRCGAHVGWLFSAVGGAVEAGTLQVASFVGLILDKIMHEDDVSNLIAVPKTYAS